MLAPVMYNPYTTCVQSTEVSQNHKRILWYNSLQSTVLLFKLCNQMFHSSAVDTHRPLTTNSSHEEGERMGRPHERMGRPHERVGRPHERRPCGLLLFNLWSSQKTARLSRTSQAPFTYCSSAWPTRNDAGMGGSVREVPPRGGVGPGGRAAVGGGVQREATERRRGANAFFSGRPRKGAKM